MGSARHGGIFLGQRPGNGVGGGRYSMYGEAVEQGAGWVGKVI